MDNLCPWEYPKSIIFEMGALRKWEPSLAVALGKVDAQGNLEGALSNLMGAIVLWECPQKSGCPSNLEMPLKKWVLLVIAVLSGKWWP